MHVMTACTAQQLLKETLISELQLLPEVLFKAENQYYKQLAFVNEKKDRLANLESELSSGDRASARSFTAPLHAEIIRAEAEANRKLAEVDYLRRKLDNYRLLATLLAK